MEDKLIRLAKTLEEQFKDSVQSIKIDRAELTLVVSPIDYHACALSLRDIPELAFEQLIDISGLDYSEYKNGDYSGKRFAVSLHLLSVSKNQRLRLKSFAEDDNFPVLSSVDDIWPSANWYEREVFDLYGIVFSGHPDMRRILTDYGFVGHPFRKDFPVTGFVEMRYDAEKARVIYQPVSIEPRENTPRVVREDAYGVTNG